MSVVNLKFFALASTLFFLLSCTGSQFSSGLTTPSPPTPAEEILINNQQFNKPYKILGPVQYTLKSHPSLFSSQLDFREQAIDLLKQQTYAQYGDEVDAIIDTRVEESVVDGPNGKLNVTHIEGVAISFLATGAGKSSQKPTTKRKQGSAKKIMVIKKLKPIKKVPEKATEKPAKQPEVEEIEISPTEILK